VNKSNALLTVQPGQLNYTAERGRAGSWTVDLLI